MESYSDLSKAAAESIEKACCQVVLSKVPVVPSARSARFLMRYPKGAQMRSLHKSTET